MMKLRAAVLACVVLAGCAAHVLQTVPTLRYDPPAGFYRSAATPPEGYSSSELNASLQVYPFRPFTGNLQEVFEKSLLRDWIDPRYREGSLAAPPDFSGNDVPGAETVVTARFRETVAGPPRERMRVLIVAGGMAALVDISADSAQSWKRAAPSILATLESLRVEAGSLSPGGQR